MRRDLTREPRGVQVHDLDSRVTVTVALTGNKLKPTLLVATETFARFRLAQNLQSVSPTVLHANGSESFVRVQRCFNSVNNPWSNTVVDVES